MFIYEFIQGDWSLRALLDEVILELICNNFDSKNWGYLPYIGLFPSYRRFSRFYLPRDLRTKTGNSEESTPL